MHIPGFGAEAALPMGGGRHWRTGIYTIRESERVVPSAADTGFTISGQDPDEPCIYRVCNFTYNPGPPAQLKFNGCNSNWICGHRSL